MNVAQHNLFFKLPIIEENRQASKVFRLLFRKRKKLLCANVDLEEQASGVPPKLALLWKKRMPRSQYCTPVILNGNCMHFSVNNEIHCWCMEHEYNENATLSATEYGTHDLIAWFILYSMIFCMDCCSNSCTIWTYIQDSSFDQNKRKMITSSL